MRKSAILLAWWFMASGADNIASTIGPLKTNAQCTLIKAQVGGKVSTCWNDKALVNKPLLFWFAVSHPNLSLVSGAYHTEAQCLAMRENLGRDSKVSTCWGS